MRDIVIAGNWKMNKDADATRDFCHALADGLQPLNLNGVQVIVAPPYPFLEVALSTLRGCPACVSAQDVSANTDGAFTGEVSASMLASLGLRHCIIGHSERRQYHQESDALIRTKLQRLLDVNIAPILCVGETLEQREAGDTAKVVLSQLEGCLRDMDENATSRVTIAYEPVWAIGTGRTATSAQAQEVHAIIRAWLDTRYGQALAQSLCVLYGGSVKPDNITELLSCQDIDGALIGGASLKITDFLSMTRSAISIAQS